MAVALRRRARPGHRRRDHRHHQRRPVHRRLPADHHPPGRGPLPAGGLAVLYHERWQIETAYFELKSTILGGRVLRARTREGIEREIWAPLVTYRALRTVITDATSTAPGADPDRASFAVALNAARDQVILAAGVTAGAVTDLAGKSAGQSSPA